MPDAAPAPAAWAPPTTRLRATTPAPTTLVPGDLVADRLRGPYRITRVTPLADGAVQVSGRHVDVGVPGSPWADARGWGVLNRCRFDGRTWRDEQTGEPLVVVADLAARPVVPAGAAPTAAEQAPLPSLAAPRAVSPGRQIDLFGEAC